MKSRSGVLVLRTVVAVLVALLGITALASGRYIAGVLLIGLAACNVAMTLTVRRRRAEMLRRFPNLATKNAASRPGASS